MRKSAARRTGRGRSSQAAAFAQSVVGVMEYVAISARMNVVVVQRVGRFGDVDAARGACRRAAVRRRCRG